MSSASNVLVDPATAAMLLRAAQRYLAADLCVLPARRVEKRPALRAWKQYQTRRPTAGELDVDFRRADAVCLLTGTISGNLELLDFDLQADRYPAWCDLVEAQAPGLLERLVLERSQSGGRHAIYRTDTKVGSNMKLAQRFVETPDGAEVTIGGKTFRPRRHGEHWGAVVNLIETRGEGGLFLCAPSPGYVLEQGDLASPLVLAAAERDILLTAAWSLNEWWPEISAAEASAGVGRPGDEYNARGDLRGLLRTHGWRLVGSGENERWCRPGKAEGTSATLRNGVFYVFSSNAAPFEPGRGYSAFQCYAALEHGNDYTRAAAALRQQGFGQQEPPTGDVDLSALLGETGGNHQDDAPAPAEAEWADPGPFPPHLLDVPGLIGRVMEHHLATAPRPQPVLALAGALCLQAILAARKVRDPRGNRTNVYVISVADSGAGKEHARQVNKAVLFHAGLDSLEGNEDIASDAGLEAALEHHPALLFQLDEIGRFLRSIGDPKKAPHLYNLIGTLMKLYSSAGSIYRGKAYGDRRRNRTIDQPCAVVHGTTVPSNFYAALTSESLADGFVSRLLVFEAGMVSAQDVDERPVPDDILEAAQHWEHLCPGGNLRAEHPSPLVFQPTPEAKELLAQLKARSDAELFRPKYLGQALWSRAVEKACRLALIHACSARAGEPVIDVAAARWGVELAEYLTRRMLVIGHTWIADGPFDAEQKRVLRIVHEAGGWLDRSALIRKLQHLPHRLRDDVLANLVETGQLSLGVIETKTKPRITYALPAP